MIRSFADERTRHVFEGRHPKGIPADILKTARRKLDYLDAATSLDALEHFPTKWKPVRRRKYDKTKT
ncbi:hypothetical protein [uncultured Methylobacterium sp.]|uniref:type II toxin-antitoxin system RelE/ParE family toxin n=1 Tax=uncultured Methylobacterium sp. TaxID=157278 RepID=UPI002598E8B8|nr:hypothetical protein [uncultured Methylobacterium sp.]